MGWRGHQGHTQTLACEQKGQCAAHDTGAADTYIKGLGHGRIVGRLVAHPQASRTSFRYSFPLAGGDTGGLAEPDPRCLLEGPVTDVATLLSRYDASLRFISPRKT